MFYRTLLNCYDFWLNIFRQNYYFDVIFPILLLFLNICQTVLHLFSLGCKNPIQWKSVTYLKVQSALTSQRQLESKLTSESAQLEIARDEVSRLTDDNIKLKETLGNERTKVKQIDLLTERLNQARDENSQLLKALGNNDEKNREVKSRLGLHWKVKGYNFWTL